VSVIFDDDLKGGHNLYVFAGGGVCISTDLLYAVPQLSPRQAAACALKDGERERYEISSLVFGLFILLAGKQDVSLLFGGVLKAGAEVFRDIAMSGAAVGINRADTVRFAQTEVSFRLPLELTAEVTPCLADVARARILVEHSDEDATILNG